MQIEKKLPWLGDLYFVLSSSHAALPLPRTVLLHLPGCENDEAKRRCHSEVSQEPPPHESRLGGVFTSGPV